MRLFKCGAVELLAVPIPYRGICGARPHPHCGSGWCVQHHEAKCAGKCVDPNPPVSVDEVSRSDAAGLKADLVNLQTSFFWLLTGMVVVTICMVVASCLRASKDEAADSILRWSTPSALGDKTCSLIAPNGAAGMLLCCREDSYSATGATCDITAEPAWFEPKDLRRSWADRDGPGPALSFGSGQKIGTHHQFIEADPYTLPVRVDAGSYLVGYEAWPPSARSWTTTPDAGPIVKTETGVELGIFKRAMYDDGGTDWNHSGYYMPNEIDGGLISATARTSTGTFYFDLTPRH